MSAGVPPMSAPVGTPAAARPGPRWWPLLGIAVLLAAALTWVWGFHGEQRQDRVLATIISGGIALILSCVWLIGFSRLRWRTRGLWVLGLVALALLGRATVERRGMTGDVVPVLGWRWARPQLSDAVPQPEGTSSPRGQRAPGLGYPQFQGPSRDGALTGMRLATDWQTRPPRPLWRRPIGAGWSGFAVSGPFAVTQEQRGEHELTSCYDRTSGELIWVHSETTRHEDPLGGPGPRATPVIVDGRVYALGATGMLNALELETGEPIWSVDIIADNGANVPTYGVAASPLVVEDRVIVLAGGPRGRSLVAYDRQNGEPVWSGGGHSAAYSSPVLARLAGRDQIVVLNGSHLVGHDASDGSLLWQYPWPDVEKVSQPVILPGERVFISTGYGVGGKLFRITPAPAGGLEVQMIWESRGLKAKLSNVVHRDGYLYGLDDGRLVCLDLDSGQREWKSGRYGHGQLVLVEDVLLIQAENGDVVLVEATPREHRELARLTALSGKTWNHPALAGRHLLVRNDREAACFELPVR